MNKLIIVIILFALLFYSCHNVQYRVTKNVEFEELKNKNKYSVVINHADTLYFKDVVHGRNSPKFKKNVCGRYYEISNNGKIILESFVVNGFVVGIYLMYNENGILKEKGFFTKDGIRVKAETYY